MVGSINAWLTLFPLTNCLIATSALAQVTPAVDGTGTVISPSGNQINISGGSLSRDGSNLFHSFERFNLSAQQTATFLSNPQIQNILGRVVGGDVSVINGLIRVTGSTANLFLINPAGILFGPNARLDVAGSLTATTATGIGFGHSWLNTFGSNDYRALVGNPQSFVLALSQSGAIANLGNLAVNPGQNLTLLGGTVLNAGTLSAPGGNITIASVAGGSLVRISQDGALMNLELRTAPFDQAGTSQSFTPVSLPALLTGGDLGNANTVTVAADGSIRLARSPTPVAATIGSTTVSGNLTVADTIGGSINVLGSNIAVQDATLNASGAIAGGNIRIGGDFRGLGTLPTATQTWVDGNSTITANALLTGNGGQVVVWADKATRFDGTIQALGGVNGGNGGTVEVSGKDTLIFRGNVDTSAPNGATGTLLLDPQNIVVVNGTGATDDAQLNDGQILAADGGASTFTISEQKLESLAGATNVTLEATNNITINDLTDNALTFQVGTGSVVFKAGGAFSMNAGDTIRAERRSVSINAASINAGAINTGTNVLGASAGAIQLTATTGSITTGMLNASSDGGGDKTTPAGGAGAITLTATTGITVSGGIKTSSSLPTPLAKYSGDGGNVSLSTTNGGITVSGDVQTFSLVADEFTGNGGNITLSAPNGAVTANNLDSRSIANRKDAQNAGAITVTAGTDITLGNVSASSTTADVTSLGSNLGSAGIVTLSASGSLQVGSINSISQYASTITPLSQPISITGKEINLTGGAKSVTGQSITLKPSTPAQNINIGGTSDAGIVSLDLTTTDLAALKDGFANITIGQPGGTGTITLFSSVTSTGSTPFKDPVILPSGGTLVGPDQATIWNITGANTGNLNGSFANGLTFNSIGNLTGGNANNNFIFANNAATISGAILGGTGTDTLNYSAYTANHTLNLAVTKAVGIENILAGTGTNTLIGDNLANTWAVTGAKSGTLNGTSFTNFQNLVGGSVADAFTLGASGSVTSINGGTGSSTLIGKDSANTWNITGANAGNVAGVSSFTNIQNVTGGSGNNTFAFTDGASVAGTINGGTGTNTLNYSAYTTPVAVNLGANTATGTGGISNIGIIQGGSSTGNTLTGTTSNNTFNITGTNAGTVGSVSFGGFSNLQGQAGNDTFTFNGGTVTTLDGGAGSNTVVGANTTNTWNLTGTASGSLNGAAFNNIQSLTGGTGNDSFAFGNGVTFGGAIDGGTGTNALDYSAFTTPLTVNLAALGATNITSVIGTTNAISTLVAANTVNTWSLTGADAGVVNGTAFSQFQNLVGGNTTDTFQLNGGSISGTVDGAGGSNAIVGTPGNDAFTVTGTNAGTVAGTNFLNVSTFDGQGGSNTLIGTAGNDVFSITGANIVSTAGITVTNVQNLDGANGNNTFAFTDGASVAGTLNGGTGTNTLNYSAYTTPVAVNLGANTATGTGGISNIGIIQGGSSTGNTLTGTTSNNTFNITGTNAGTVGSVSFGGFSNLQGQAGNDTFTFNGGTVTTLDGGAGSNTVVGANTTNTWNLTGTASGSLNGAAFNNIQSLTGGTGNDSFAFGNGVTFGGAIDGGTGTNALDYSAFTTPLTVNLAALGATNITSVIGTTNAISTLVAANTVNTWSLTGADAGVVNGTAFSQFQNLVGGNTTDTFQLNGGSISGTVDGAGGSNAIVGTPGNDTFTVTGTNAGTVAGTNFLNVSTFDGQGGSNTLIGTAGNDVFSITGANIVSTAGITVTNVQNLDGANGNNTFAFTDGASVAGTLNGGTGTNTLNYSAYTTPVAVNLGANTATGTGGISNIGIIQGGSSTGNTLTGTTSNNTFNITGTNAGTVGGLTFGGFSNLQGQAGNDTFTFNGGTVTTLDGGAGSNTVVGANTTNTWNLTGTASGSLNGAAFNNIQSLTGGTGNDSFAFGNGVTFGGAIDGGTGTNALDYSAFTTTLTVNLAALGATNITSVIGTTNAISTLVAANTVNTWSLTGADAGVVNGTAFSQFQNLVGGNTTDTFQLNGGSISGTVDGAGGSNAIVGTPGNDTFTVTGTNAGTANGNSFTNIATLNGAGGNDTFHLNGGTVGSVDGGIGNNTLISDAIANTWTITGSNTGQVNSIPFSNIQNLTGGNQNNTVAFTGTIAQIDGNFTGGAGDLTLLGDKVSVGGTISGSGHLLIQPLSSGQGIQLGGTGSSDPGVLALTGAELSGFQNGFNTITIGRSDGSGVITLASNVAFADPVTLQSPNGFINTNGFNLSGTDNASFTLLASQSITTAAISTQGGAIALTSNLISTGNLTTQNSAGAGGDLTLQSNGGAIATNALNTSGTTNGGNILVTANTQIIAGSIDTSGITGSGGNVALTSARNIQTDSINTQAGTAGGNVDITTATFFRATSTFTASNGTLASISAIGGSSGGSVTIRHGGNGLTPFDVGNGTTNGTAGAITSGSFSITPFQSFPGIYVLGNLSILTTEIPAGSSPTLPGLPFSYLKQEDPKITLEEDNVLDIERKMTREFQDYLTLPKEEIKAPLATIAQTRAILHKVESTRGLKPALLYVYFVPSRISSTAAQPDPQTPDKTKALIDSSALSKKPNALTQGTAVQVAQLLDQVDRPGKEQDTLELVLITADAQPIRHHLWNVNRAQVLQVVHQLQQQVTDATTSPGEYLPPAQQLYNWIVDPVRADLKRHGIQNIIFIMDDGLRSIPVAALHNGSHFLVQDYSVSLMPSFSLTQLSSDNIHDMKVLAMGASEFKEQSPLPAVPLEILTITTKQWKGESLLNNDFTIQNLKSQRSQRPFKIVHLATHGSFLPGKASNSYIQFWDQKLHLDQLRQLGLQDPPVELLVLSACTTALGDEKAELGFAGMAVQVGVISSLASLWAVSDEATLGLMTEFYHQLRSTRTKVEALRQAQLAMIDGKIRLENGHLISAEGEQISLPPQLANSGTLTLTHPLYWSAFTLIGSPW